MTATLDQESELQLLVAAESLWARAGLAALLEERGWVVLAAVDGADLERDIERYEPDALVIDLGWGSAAMRERLRDVDGDLPILALSAEDEDEASATLALVARISPQFALLVRESDADRIDNALSAVDAGLTVIDPRLKSLFTVPKHIAAAHAHNPLTARENEVLQLLARGLTNRAIALELGITQHTVKFHVNAIMGKLDAQSRTEAVVRATQLGMIIL